jgi:hypothetical protein
MGIRSRHGQSGTLQEQRMLEGMGSSYDQSSRRLPQLKHLLNHRASRAAILEDKSSVRLNSMKLLKWEKDRIK